MRNRPESWTLMQTAKTEDTSASSALFRLHGEKYAGFGGRRSGICVNPVVWGTSFKDKPELTG